ncbi:PAS domain S-box-containing protein [Cyclonatronum proteinivorum]|uniref:PAS domain S-box-containing protein n=1 Tax=Cyclonatronum proteinivorum TaxID=1457365 RepID=A0A345UJG3_9BACT|nr:PAS domain S-box-containing protein [Cyclonatronum proteinivorum]
MRNSGTYSVLATDMQGNIMYVNPCYNNRFARVRDMRGGLNFSDTIHPEDSAMTLEAAVSCMAHPDQPVTLMLRKPGPDTDSWILTRWEFSLIQDAEQNPLGILAVGHDATKEEENRKETEDTKVRLEAILNSTSDGHILVGRDFKLQSFNKAAALAAQQVFGKPLYNGCNIYDFVLPENLQEFKQDAAKALAGKTIKKDKNINGFWFQFRYYPVYGARKEVVGFTLNTTNIDERKKAEEYRRALLTNLPDDLYVVRSDGSITDIQLQGKKDTAGLTTQFLHHIFTKETAAMLLLQIKAAINEKKNGQVSFSVEDGQQTNYFDASISPLQSDTALMLVRDVSLRVRATQERQKFAKYQEQVSRNVPGVIYQFRMLPDRSMHFTFASEGLTKLFDVIPEQIQSNASAAFSNIHADDQKRIFTSILDSAKTLTNWEQTFRIKNKSGQIVWIEAKSTPYRDNDGSTVWNGYLHDVSERVQNEQQLQNSRNLLEESEHKLQQTIEAIPDPMLIFCEDFRIQFVNNKFEKVYGYTEEEVLNRRMEFLIPKELRKNHRAKQQTYLRAGGKNTRMESFLPTLNKAGQLIVVNASLNTFTAGGQKFIIVIMQDVTELKKRQDIILKQNETFRQIAWQQSHELRRPVANILGICNYFDDVSPKSHAELNDIIGYLRSEIKELDAIIRETVKQANESETRLNLPPPAHRSE